MNFTEKSSDRTRFINRAVNSLHKDVFNLLDFMEKYGKDYSNYSASFRVSDNFASAFNTPYFTDFSEYWEVENPSIMAIKFKEIYNGLNFSVERVNANKLRITINK